MVSVSRLIRGIKLGMNKKKFAAIPISLKGMTVRAPAVRRSEIHTRHGPENASFSS